MNKRQAIPSITYHRLVVFVSAIIILLVSASVFSVNSASAASESGSVADLSLTVSPPTVSAQNATYTLKLIATNGISNGSNIFTIVAPNGTSFSDSNASLVDNTEPADSYPNMCVLTGTTPNVVYLNTCDNAFVVGAGDSVTLTISGVINPSTVNREDTLSIATDNDTVALTSSPYAIVVGQVSGLTVSPAPSSNGFQNAIYTLNFIATDGISAGSNVFTIVAPNGTSFSNSSASLVDNTEPADSFSNWCVNTYTTPNVVYLSSCDNAFVVGAGDSVTLTISGVINPSSPGSYTLTLATDNDPTATVSPPYTIAPQGYWLVASDGGLFSYGNAQFYGSMGGHPLNQPIVGMAAVPEGGGYWEVASDGGIFSFGDAHFYGSMGGHPLNQPVVGMAAVPGGGGYWEVASDGGIFSFGDAHFYGSMGGHPLNQPIVGMAADQNTGGYWFVAADGGIFSFNAPFFGSEGAQSLSAPIVSMAATQNGSGYVYVGSDGSIYTFGSAASEGSPSGEPLNAPIVGIAATS